MTQLNLFANEVLRAVASTGSTSKTYDIIASRLGVSQEDMNEKVSAGKAGKVSGWKRKVRWVQQSLKQHGLIKNTDRDCWSVTGKGQRMLSIIHDDQMRVVFSTGLGMMLWGDCRHLGKLFKNEINAIITSPPYLLQNPKEYGGTSSSSHYIDQFLRWADNWRAALTDNGSIVINLGDGFKPGAYAMTLYKERLLIALEEELGLQLVQRFEWFKPNALANPISPICIRRTHCVPTLESFFWLSAEPENVTAMNRNVLVEYAESTKRLMERGVRKAGVRLRPSGNKINDDTFLKDNGGAIPGNLLCSYPEGSNTPYTRYCRENNLPIHPARFPIDLPKFFIKYLTNRDDLVADPFSGSGTTCAAAESLNRRWVGTDRALEYIIGSIGRFNSVTPHMKY